MLKNVSPGPVQTTCSYSQAVVEHVMDSINCVESGGEQRRREKEEECEKGEQQGVCMRERELQLLIRKV